MIDALFFTNNQSPAKMGSLYLKYEEVFDEINGTRRFNEVVVFSLLRMFQ